VKAATCTNAEFEVAELSSPAPGPGQVLLRVERCGICGSDLHARHGCDEWADMAERMGYDRFARSSEAIVYGHEFSGVVEAHGRSTRRKVREGSPVVALPLLRSGDGVDTLGLSVHAPGAYAEQVVVQEALMMPVPNGLPADVAAMTEPMAVAWHAVRRGGVGRKTVAVVIGCGPVGLGVILMLKADGVETVVASDYSPGRRALATACGADIVVDPSEASPYTAAPGSDHLDDIPAAFELAVGMTERVTRLPGWWHAWRLAERLGAGPKHPVVFECVGVPGIIDGIIEGAPLFSRVVVVGVCVGVDRFLPAMAINKEIDLRFVLGYTPLEFHDTLHMLAEGKVDPRPLLTGSVGLGGVAGAFDALGDPEAHAKILVDPGRPADDVSISPA
jgi:threonine dehydrogenase-like Zn-dependent dehydrogenase